MEVEYLKNNLIHVKFRTRVELMKTFIRFQEYYESPEFKDKVFTLNEFKKWYKKNKGRKRFTYYTDWSGCNVPSYVFDFFREGHFGKLHKREKKLLKELPVEGKYYVIGTFGDGSTALDHEMVHSLYYSNDEYRREINNILQLYSGKYVELESYVMNLGYNKSVLLDECQAYSIADHEYLSETKGIKMNLQLTEELRTIYKAYSLSNERENHD